MNRKNIVILTTLFTIALMGLSIFAVPTRASSLNPSSVMQSVEIDGTIKDDEWIDADWYNIPFYLNVNNTDGDVDGYNYLSVGEDENNVLLSLDLCSDRTDNEDGEWLGVWLNNGEREFEHKYDYFDYIDNGTDYLVHDVDNERTYPLLSENMTTYNNYLNDSSIIGNTVNMINGTLVGDEESFHPESGCPAALQSDDSIFKANFSMGIFWLFMEHPYLVDKIKDASTITMNLSYYTSHFVGDIDEMYLEIYNGDIIPLELSQDGDHIINTTIQWRREWLLNDLYTNFSIVGVNETGSFEMVIEHLYFEIEMPSPQYSDMYYELGFYGGSTLDYEIKWSFGSSENCDEDHRMFEISIDKDSIEKYDADEDLGIFIAGYGTMSFEADDYWFYGAMGSTMCPYVSEYYVYLNMKGDELPSEPDDGFDFLGLTIEQLSIIIGVIISIVVSLIALLGLGIGIKKRRNKACLCQGQPDCECSL